MGGWGTWQHCSNNRTWNAGYKPNGAVTDAADCDPAIPSLIYDPVTNPEGVRCTWHDNLVNVFGRTRLRDCATVAGQRRRVVRTQRLQRLFRELCAG